MNIQEFQKICAQIVSNIDKKYSIDRDFYVCFTQIIEEIGELAKAINMKKLGSKNIDEKNLKEEFADVILQLFMLAELFNIDVEEVVNNKVKILKQRHNL